MKKMKDYQIFKCPYCSCEYYDKTAKKRRKVGNPLVECPQCGKVSYRSTILEPALISERLYFNIRFASFYGNLRIGMILIYAVFLFLILVLRDTVLGLSLVGVAAAIYMLYELIKVFHRNKFLKSDDYDKEIAYSLQRLSDTSYAKVVIRKQGIDETSVYYYEIQKNSENDGEV